ncbi:hypothetical protein ASG29_15270 [Sphingomonas sp. Leaf412]|uniref:sensor histidine kinase n=1 Tax=Sphingomonas sp. Leaf412 TaxID=1736370 RepID=UPI0006FC9C14|nr:PAS domain-containing sensor histidine kinase [Sphingomonas sp. Leaf412]KQT31318.1 hypothetical protein ASG29_15270 [Sphingomonas sp. Leaf412]
MKKIGRADPLPPPVDDPSVPLTLQLLADTVPGGLALLVSGGDGKPRVEASCPPRLRVGTGLRVPPGLLTAHPVAFDASTRRVPAEWTAILGDHPAHFAAVPVGERALHLVLAGTGGKAIAPPSLARWGQLMSRLLDRDRISLRADASRRLAALIDGLPSPLAFVDGGTIEVFVNDGARQLLGIAPGVRSARTIAAALALLVQQDGDGQAAALARDPMASLTFAIDRGGRHFAVDSRWVSEPELTGRVWLFRDVTDDYRIARFRDELVSNVSHELRTPLTSILGALTLLDVGPQGGVSEENATLIDIALRNGRRLLGLVGDLLDLDRAEAHGLNLARRPTDLSLLLADAIVQNRPMAQRHDVTVTLLVDDDGLGVDHHADVDPDRLLQVVGNLLSNAVKFSPEGGAVTVRLRRAATGWRLTVADEGAGIPDELREQLFTRFARGSTPSRIGIPGTGLGLAIVKAIVEAHGGTIAVEPPGGGGAVFHVDLPD